MRTPLLPGEGDEKVMPACHLLKNLIKQFGANPDMCGISKSQVTVWKKYIPFIESLSEESGIDEDTIADNVSPSSVKRLLTMKKTSVGRIAGEKHIIETLKIKKSPSKRTIEDAMGIDCSPKRMVNTIALRKLATEPVVLVSSHNGEINEKIRAFKSILTTGQQKLWMDYVIKHDLENEYEALSKVTILLEEL